MVDREKDPVAVLRFYTKGEDNYQGHIQRHLPGCIPDR